MAERFERPRSRLTAFAVILGVALAGGYGLGAAVGGGSTDGEPGPAPAHHLDEDGAR